MNIANEIASGIAKLDCNKHLPFPEARGEFYHGYYQGVRDALEIAHSYMSSKERLLHSIIKTNKGEWCQNCQEFVEKCKAPQDNK